MNDVLDLLSTLGLGGIAVGMALEALGVPFFPGGIMIILAGFLINQGRLEFYPALTAAFLGYTLGSTSAYLIGKNIGEPFFRRYGRYLGVLPEHFHQARVLPASSVGLLVLLGRLIPGIGNITPYLAGLANLEAGHFIIYNSFFGLAWGALYLSIGMFFGHNWPVIMNLIRPRLVGIGILGILLAVVVYAVKQRRKFHHQ
ncbi:MAG: DedA family protein [Peptococcaceae bacterium]|nr:DedA family protein [Peptococcaceae bacterium]